MVTARWWVLRTGAAWRDVPREFGPWSSVYTRWRRWSRAGLWRRVVRSLRRLAVGRLWLADGSHIKVHQHGANPTGGQAAQAIGRTKGGLNSKLTVLADTHGRIVDFTLAAGPRNEQYTVLPLLPAARGRWLVADRGFDSNVFRQRLQQHRIRPCIPPTAHSQARAALPPRLLPSSPQGRKCFLSPQAFPPPSHSLREARSFLRLTSLLRHRSRLAHLRGLKTLPRAN